MSTRAAQRAEATRVASAALRGLVDLVDVDHFREHQLEIAVSVAVYRMDVWVGLACGSGKTLIAGLALKMMCEPNQNYYGIMESPMKLSIKGTARQLQRLGITAGCLQHVGTGNKPLNANYDTRRF